MELQKTYEPQSVENRLYDKWQKNGYFHGVVDKNKQPYTIVIPPPNITGQLHMGHALDNTLQDAIIRFRRMEGYAALWLPGTDHASIATEVKLVNQLSEEGLTKNDVGRDGFLERAWAWRAKYGGRIVEQLKRMGSSCDWERERFTMDEGLSRAVREAFVRLYEKGLIYRGDRIINWCPNCKTALSDAEVEYTEQASHLWYIRYPAEDGGEGITVATTRPETMLGDSAVAVNPADEKFAHLIGKNVMLPLMDRAIPVIADEYVELGFGTGAVKITPAHDPNDFEVGLRHSLPVIRIMDDAGVINELGGKYCGQDRFEARKNIVADLTELGLMVKIEDYAHNVGACYRCGTTVEPIVSKQWFVSMKPLAEPAIAAVENGNTTFVPERFSKTYFNWMYNIRDWCISRQLWWGHRIPAFYCDDCGEMTVARTDVTVCPKCGGTHIRQDEDVLDTWFSSGLWPFSTLGWPDKTPELDFFYPTSVLVTAYDIIFFWVARMIVFGCECMGQKPFSNVFIHGIVRDAQGRKMSKSLNNGIDPLEIIDRYGADALRFSLATGVSPGNDMRFYMEKVESARNFANKIWNASRFVLMNTDGRIPGESECGEYDISDKWILSRLNDVIRSVTDNMEKFELGVASQRVYDFMWSEYCDWYIEMAKPRLLDGSDRDKATAMRVLSLVLIDILKLLHPFMPFITEELYCSIETGDETIMTADWPTPRELDFAAEEESMQSVMELIRGIRNVRAEMNVPPSRRCKLFIAAGDEGRRDIALCEAYLKRLAFATEIDYIDKKGDELKDAVSVVSHIAEAYLPLEELIDMDAERARLAKERESLLSEIARVDGKLNNAGFTAKAPEAVVAAERDKRDKYVSMLAKVDERIASLG